MKPFKSDLFVLVADKQMQYAVTGLLNRPQDIGCRPFSFRVEVHPGRDAGCFNDAHEYLRSFAHMYGYALVVFDNEFDRAKKLQGLDRAQLQERVNRHLSQNGWPDRAAAIVIRPELEVWVWADCHEIAPLIGWGDRGRELRSWLESKRLWPEYESKPPDPKEALDAALREKGKKRSARRFEDLATHVSFQGCEDEAFQDFRETLRQWFPDESA